jgi:Uma2 family endonuclease
VPVLAMEAGVAEYWIVDLDARLVERWRPEDVRPEILDRLLTWAPPELSAPLELDLPANFDEVLGSAHGEAAVEG